MSDSEIKLHFDEETEAIQYFVGGERRGETNITDLINFQDQKQKSSEYVPSNFQNSSQYVLFNQYINFLDSCKDGVTGGTSPLGMNFILYDLNIYPQAHKFINLKQGYKSYLEELEKRAFKKVKAKCTYGHWASYYQKTATDAFSSYITEPGQDFKAKGGGKNYTKGGNRKKEQQNWGYGNFINKKYFTWECGLSPSLYVRYVEDVANNKEKEPQAVVTPGGIVDPLSKQSILLWPNPQQKAIITKKAMEIFGFGESYFEFDRTGNGINEDDWELLIDILCGIGCQNSQGCVITNQNLKSYIEGNLVKGQKISDKSTGAKEKIKLLVVKELGDKTQVLFYLLMIKTSEEYNNCILCTCDMVVFLFCISLELPCIFNGESKVVNENSPEIHQDKIGHGFYRIVFYPGPESLTKSLYEKFVSQVELIIRENEAIIKLLEQLSDPARIMKIPIKCDFLDRAERLGGNDRKYQLNHVNYYYFAVLFLLIKNVCLQLNETLKTTFKESVLFQDKIQDFLEDTDNLLEENSWAAISSKTIHQEIGLNDDSYEYSSIPDFLEESKKIFDEARNKLYQAKTIDQQKDQQKDQLPDLNEEIESLANKFRLLKFEGIKEKKTRVKPSKTKSRKKKIDDSNKENLEIHLFERNISLTASKSYNDYLTPALDTLKVKFDSTKRNSLEKFYKALIDSNLLKHLQSGAPDDQVNRRERRKAKEPDSKMLEDQFSNIAQSILVGGGSTNISVGGSAQVEEDKAVEALENKINEINGDLLALDPDFDKFSYSVSDLFGQQLEWLYTTPGVTPDYTTPGVMPDSEIRFKINPADPYTLTSDDPTLISRLNTYYKQKNKDEVKKQLVTKKIKEILNRDGTWKKYMEKKNPNNNFDVVLNYMMIYFALLYYDNTFNPSSRQQYNVIKNFKDAFPIGLIDMIKSRFDELSDIDICGSMILPLDEEESSRLKEEEEELRQAEKQQRTEKAEEPEAAGYPSDGGFSRWEERRNATVESPNDDPDQFKPTLAIEKKKRMVMGGSQGEEILDGQEVYWKIKDCIMALLTGNGEKLTSEEVNEIIHKADIDDNGFISKQELRLLLTNLDDEEGDGGVEEVKGDNPHFSRRGAAQYSLAGLFNQVTAATQLSRIDTSHSEDAEAQEPTADVEESPDNQFPIFDFYSNIVPLIKKLIENNQQIHEDGIMKQLLDAINLQTRIYLYHQTNISDFVARLSNDTLFEIKEINGEDKISEDSPWSFKIGEQTYSINVPHFDNIKDCLSKEIKSKINEAREMLITLANLPAKDDILNELRQLAKRLTQEARKKTHEKQIEELPETPEKWINKLLEIRLSDDVLKTKEELKVEFLDFYKSVFIIDLNIKRRLGNIKREERETDLNRDLIDWCMLWSLWLLKKDPHLVSNIEDEVLDYYKNTITEFDEIRNKSFLLEEFVSSPDLTSNWELIDNLLFMANLIYTSLGSGVESRLYGGGDGKHNNTEILREVAYLGLNAYAAYNNASVSVNIFGAPRPPSFSIQSYSEIIQSANLFFDYMDKMVPLFIDTSLSQIEPVRFSITEKAGKVAEEAEKAPEEKAPEEPAPAEVAPDEEAPVEPAKATRAPDEEVPVEPAQEEEAQAEAAQTEAAPAEAAPAEAVQSQAAPVEPAKATRAQEEEAQAEAAQAEAEPAEEEDSDDPDKETPVIKPPVNKTLRQSSAVWDPETPEYGKLVRRLTNTGSLAAVGGKNKSHKIKKKHKQSRNHRKNFRKKISLKKIKKRKNSRRI